MRYAIGLSIGFWAIVVGLLVGFWHGWLAGGALILLGVVLITAHIWRSLDDPDPYEDEHSA